MGSVRVKLVDRLSLLKTSRVQIIFLLLLSLCYFLFLDYEFGLGRILAQIQDVGVLKSLILMISILFTHVIRSYRLFLYLNLNHGGTAPITSILFFVRCFSLLQTYNLMNLFFPFRSGELSFPILLKSVLNIEMTRALGILTWLRGLDLYFLLAFLAILTTFQVMELPNVAICVIFVILLMLPAFLNKEVRLLKIPNTLLQHLPRFLSEYSAGMPQNLKASVYSWALTFLNWSLKLLIFGIFIHALFGLDLWTSIYSVLGGELISISPLHAPGGIGSYALGVSAGISFQNELKLGTAFELGVILHFFVVTGSFLSLIVSKVALLLYSNKT